MTYDVSNGTLNPTIPYHVAYRPVPSSKNLIKVIFSNFVWKYL